MLFTLWNKIFNHFFIRIPFRYFIRKENSSYIIIGILYKNREANINHKQVL